MFDGVEYIPIDQILEKVQRDNPWIETLHFYDACEYVDDLYGLVGAPNTYFNQVTGNSLIRPHVSVEEYVGLLPVDFIEMKPGGVRNADTNIVYRYASGSFIKSAAQLKKTDYQHVDHVYYMSNGRIYVTDETATLQLSYLAMPIDDRGFPLIPQKPKFREAAAWYIAMKEAWKKWSVGKLTDKVYQEVTKEAHWYLGAAGTESKLPNMDQMETWKNMYTRLYPKVDFHKSSFAFAGIQEDIQTGTNRSNV